MEGWIKIHRKLLENPIVSKDSDHLAIWIYLLLNATHKEIPAVFKGEKIILQPGQLITGRKSMSEKLKISESKIFRVINEYKSEQQIEQQTSNKNSLITILNWNIYQQSEQQIEQQMNNKRTTNEQQLNTNKNVNNDNNILFINLFNKYKGLFDFTQSMKEKQKIFIKNCINDEEYKKMTADEQTALYSRFLSIF